MYVWGGARPGGFDCSGLVVFAYRAVGVQLSHYTDSIAAETVPIDVDDVQPGDLVLFRFYDPGQPRARYPHVAIYAGDGQIVDSSYGGVQVRPLWAWGARLEFRRVPGA